jgi:tetratricopeptide (TPR) repeat protein
VHWVEGQLQERRGESPLPSVRAGLASLDRASASFPAAEVSPSLPTIASALHRLQASWESGHGIDPRAALGRSVEAARRAIALQAGRGSAHNNLGSALYVLALHTERQPESAEHLDAATSAFTRCVELNPNLPACRINLGNCWKERAEREQTAGADPTIYLHRAILAYEGALPLSPKLGALQNNLGNVHLTLAERELDAGKDPTASLDRARTYYLKAMELRQRYSIAALNLGATERFRLRYLLAHGRDGKGALAEARRALSLAGEYNPEDVDVPLEQARVELLTRDRARFDRALRQAAQINAAAPEIGELREEWVLPR